MTRLVRRGTPLWTTAGRCRSRPKVRSVPGGLRSAHGVGTAVVLLLVAVLSAPAWATDPGTCPPADDGCVEVGPDPQDAAFVGTGGLLIPGNSFTGTADDRRSTAECVDCEWALVPVCKRGTGDVGCGPAATSCPAGSRRMVILLRRPPSPTWDTVGSMCVSGAPLTVDDVAQQLSDVVIERVPPLRPSVQPAGGTVVNLPAIFASGQPERMSTRRFDLVGFAVVLDARATWRWRFGDGAEVTTQLPGGAWPDDSVSHVYRTPGQRVVSVVAQWQGWFTVDGMGPFPVAGPSVTQVSAPLPLPVYEARAVLVGE